MFMTWRDKELLKKLEEMGIKPIMYKRYVDDSRHVLRQLAEGIRWDGNKFIWDKDAHDIDVKTSWITHDQKRTTKDLTKAMNSMIYFLRFTIEDYTDFKNERLPKLDIELWTENGQIKYSFYCTQ